jgi:hypothetical protein
MLPPGECKDNPPPSPIKNIINFGIDVNKIATGHAIYGGDNQFINCRENRMLEGNRVACPSTEPCGRGTSVNARF